MRIIDVGRSRYKIQLTRVQACNFTDVPPFVPNAFTPTVYPISFLTLSGSLDRIEACFESVEYYKHLAWFTRRWWCFSISIIDDEESWHVIGNHIGVILIIEKTKIKLEDKGYGSNNVSYKKFCLKVTISCLIFYLPLKSEISEFPRSMFLCYRKKFVHEVNFRSI